jgi:ribosome-binding protein aMBF1 (putative translation factor)
VSNAGGTLYAIQAEGTSLVKIGFTRGSVEKRLKVLQTGQPFPLQVIATVPVESDVRHKEGLLHAFLATERRRGEWFEVALQSDDFAALLERAIAFGAQEEARKQAAQEQSLLLVRHAASAARPKTEIGIILGERIRSLRERQGISQRALARALDTSANAINYLESGMHTPHIERLIALADLFDVSLDYLVGMTDDPRHFRNGVCPPCPTRPR